MDTQSATHSDYVPHAADQRAAAQRPTDSTVLKGEGRVEGETTASSAYRPGQAVRFQIPQTDGMDAPTSNAEGGKSVSRTDYAADADFQHELHHHGIVPRFEESTDLWKTNQPMDGQTISQTSYTRKHVERVKLMGDQRKSEFEIGTAAERQNGNFESVSQHDFIEHPDFHRSPAVRPHEGLQLSHEGRVDGRSAYKESYQAPTLASKSKVVRPSTALHLAGEHEVQSGYQREFVNVQPQADRCIAGELVDGVRHHRRKTPHFKLRDVHHGHHFFEPRTGESSSSSTRTTDTADSDATLT